MKKQKSKVDISEVEISGKSERKIKKRKSDNPEIIEESRNKKRKHFSEISNSETDLKSEEKVKEGRHLESNIAETVVESEFKVIKRWYPDMDASIGNDKVRTKKRHKVDKTEPFTETDTSLNKLDDCDDDVKYKKKDKVKAKKSKKSKTSLESEPSLEPNEKKTKKKKRSSGIATSESPGKYDLFVAKPSSTSTLTGSTNATAESTSVEEKKKDYIYVKGRKVKKKEKKKKLKLVSGVAAESAVEYLRSWATDRDEWSFKKVRQVWLLHNIYNEDKIGEDDFEILLRYLDGMKGQARTQTSLEAEKIVNVSAQGESVSTEKLRRAHEIIKILSD